MNDLDKLKELLLFDYESDEMLEYYRKIDLLFASNNPTIQHLLNTALQLLVFDDPNIVYLSPLTYLHSRVRLYSER